MGRKNNRKKTIPAGGLPAIQQASENIQGPAPGIQSASYDAMAAAWEETLAGMDLRYKKALEDMQDRVIAKLLAPESGWLDKIGLILCAVAAALAAYNLIPYFMRQ